MRQIWSGASSWGRFAVYTLYVKRDRAYEKTRSLLQSLRRIQSQRKIFRKGHAAHICKSCASLPPEKQAEQMTINRLLNLPWRLSKEQISWLKNRMEDKRPEVRALAKEQYEMRFPPKQLEDTDDDFDFLDENDFIE